MFMNSLGDLPDAVFQLPQPGASTLVPSMSAGTTKRSAPDDHEAEAGRSRRRRTAATASGATAPRADFPGATGEEFEAFPDRVLVDLDDESQGDVGNFFATEAFDGQNESSPSGDMYGIPGRQDGGDDEEPL